MLECSAYHPVPIAQGQSLGAIAQSCLRSWLDSGQCQLEHPTDAQCVLLCDGPSCSVDHRQAHWAEARSLRSFPLSL